MAILDTLTELKDALFPGKDWATVLAGGAGVTQLLASLTGQSEDEIARTVQNAASSSATASTSQGTSDVATTGSSTQSQVSDQAQTTAGTSESSQVGTTQQDTVGTSEQVQTTAGRTGGPQWWEDLQQQLAGQAQMLPGYEAYFTGDKPVVGAWSGAEEEALQAARGAGKSVLDMGIEKYMNPYMENVLNPMLRRQGEDQALERQKEAAARVSRGGFGSARADLLANQMAERQGLAREELTQRGYEQAYNNATALATGDAERLAKASTLMGTLGGTQRGIQDAEINRLYEEYQRIQNDPRDLAKTQFGLIGGLRPEQLTTNTGATTGTTTGSSSGISAQDTVGSTTGSTLGTTSTLGQTDTSQLSSGVTTGATTGTQDTTSAQDVTGVKTTPDRSTLDKLAVGLANLDKSLFPT